MSLMIEEIDAIDGNLEKLVAERTSELRAREADLRVQNLRFDVALNNMTQGLILYNSSARLIVCNQRYVEMYGMSPDIAKPGCSFRDLIMHRKHTGSFKGDVDDFCSSVLRNVALGEITYNIVETVDGRSIEIVNRPLLDGGGLPRTKIYHRPQTGRRTDHPSCALRRIDRSAKPRLVPRTVELQTGCSHRASSTR